MENSCISKIKSPVDLSNLNKELHFLIAKYLSGGPCQEAAAALRNEIQLHEIIPKRVTWEGESTSQDYQQYSASQAHVTSDHLPQLLEQYLQAVQKKENVRVGCSRSILSSQLLRSHHLLSNTEHPPRLAELLSRKQIHGPIKTWGNGQPINAVHAICSREVKGVGVGSERITTNFYYDRLKLSCRSVGHLSAVYCVLYDRTGRYIFTGADDKLVKVWSAVNGRLLATMRGATGEITDMAINNENTLLAVGTNDKLIRVWSLLNCASLAVLNVQSGNITSVFFCPMSSSLSHVRYLASTSTDGSCAFWAYIEKPGQDAKFQPKPTLYQEKMRPGHAQILCASFSSGGVFMAAGSADNNVRVYYMLGGDGPTRILEVECHKEKVDSISWAHRGLKFISGSKDGTALIYRYESQQWRYTRIHCCKSLPGEPSLVIDDPKKRPRVTMVAWNRDDSLVLTATATSDHIVKDNVVKVWNSLNGSLLRVLKAHQDEIFVIEAHPFNPSIVCTAGHDGLIAMWDIGTTSSKANDSYGKKIFEHTNDIEGMGHGSIFDCKFSPDGLGLAATDSHGHLLIFSVDNGKESKFACLPKELFFHTDYRPFSSSSASPQVLDEQTQVETHLMPPPFLVDTEGNPYPPPIQKLVPGREGCKVDQLIPAVAVAPGGRREVIEGLPSLRSNIDEMIAQLAARNQGGENQQGGEPSPNADRPAQRRDLNGMHQSTATWQPGTFFGFRKKIVVPPLPSGVLRFSEEERRLLGENEEDYYQIQSKKSPSSSNVQPNPLISPTFSPSGRLNRTRRQRRPGPVYFQPYAEDGNVLDQDEGVARPNPPQQEISVSQESPRRPIRSIRSSQGARAPRRVRYNVRRLLDQHGHESDPDNVDHIPSTDDSDSESLDDLMASSSSDSEEESDSDWGNGTRTRDQENNVKTKSSRSRTRNLSTSPPRGKSQTSRKRIKQDKSDSGGDSAGSRPGPSSEIKVEIKTELAAKSKPRKKRVVEETSGLDEIPEPFRPPEWLSEIMPKRTPYFPQLGDDLVYFRQGHELYVQQVENQKIYSYDKKTKKQLPFVQYPDLQAEVSVRVVQIKFEIVPPRVVNLKLARTNWETGELIGSHIFVKYHDISDVVDFLVLRQIYDKSVCHRWNVGDRFRCLIDKTWWLGTVSSKKSRHPDFPDSNFLCYDIEWIGDDQNHESLSPWDMEIITDDFEIPDDGSAKDGIPASEADIRNNLYEVRPEDWEPHGHQDAECQRISNLVEGVMDLAISEAFSTPVDLNAYPEYAFSIEYPIDLSTIKARLDNLFYRRADAIITDIEHIAINAEKFNQPDADIVKHAKIIKTLLLEILENEDFRNVNEAYHRISETYISRSGAEPKKTLKVRKPSIASSSNSEPTPGPSTSNPRSTPFTSRLRKRLPKMKSRTRRGDTSDDSVKPWQDRCRDLLQIVWNRADSEPFRHPVSVIEYPDYNQVIDTPMCLSMVKEDLRGGNYDTPTDFHKDMMIIFQNSRQYNTDQRSAIRLMTLRLQSFYEANIRKILDDWKPKRPSRTVLRKNSVSDSQRTPTKNSRIVRPQRNHAMVSSPKIVSSPRQRADNLPERRQLPIATRNGGPSVASPARKYPQREAAAKNPFIRHSSRNSLPSSPPKKALFSKGTVTRPKRGENGNDAGRSGVGTGKRKPTYEDSDDVDEADDHSHSGTSDGVPSRNMRSRVPAHNRKIFEDSEMEEEHSGNSEETPSRPVRKATKKRENGNHSGDHSENSEWGSRLRNGGKSRTGKRINYDDSEADDHSESSGGPSRNMRSRNPVAKKRKMDDDDSDAVGKRTTRYRGKAVKTYAESGASNDDEEDESSGQEFE